MQKKATLVYQKDMDPDEDGDGKITYDEYMKYCQEQEECQDKKQPEKASIERI